MSEPATDPPPLSKSTGTTLNALTPLIPTYTHLILTALLPIVAGAHASITRPNNVRPPYKKSEDKPNTLHSEEDQDDEDDVEDSMPVETLSPKDAILFPITAGIMLGGLYLTIKYLDDPTILSRIMTYYFTLVGTFAVGKFFADALGVYVSLVFPRRWSVTIGGKRRVYVAGHDRYKLVTTEGEKVDAAFETEKLNPFPRSIIPIPKSLYQPIWALRRSLLAKWAVVFKLGRSKGGVTRTTFWVGDIVGLGLGVLCVIGYLVSGKHWIGTNIMGVSFAYGAMQIISPATFGTATLLLSLLFFYDIYFVFYTPLMVTVATNLDVPIKLLFPRPLLDENDPEQSKKRGLAMLGLGDVVLPGIMIAMALRFDFWRWCEARRETEQAAAGAEAASGASASKMKQEQLQNLPKYIKPTGTWGERLWNCGNQDLPGVFPKTYFWSSIVGYIIGMLATLYVMHVWNHAQPALLYLVPGVLGAVWGTAVVRKEVKLAWNYSEEVVVEDDEEEKKKKKEDDERVKKKGKKEQKEKKGEDEKAQEQQSESSRETTATAVTSEDKKNDSDKDSTDLSSESRKSTSASASEGGIKKVNNDEEEGEEEIEDDDIELVDEKGEAEYISVKIVKKPAPGAAFARR